MPNLGEIKTGKELGHTADREQIPFQMMAGRISEKRIGHPRSEETKNKISQGLKRYNSDPNNRAVILQRARNRKRGYSPTPEHRYKASIALKGRKLNPEHAEKIRQIHMARKGTSPKYGVETRQKALELYRSGLSSTMVGNVLGIPGDIIKYWARQMGISHTRSETLRRYPPTLGKHPSNETIEKMLKSQHASLSRRPNSTEQKLLLLIEETCPKEYIYTGDKSLIINGMSPDFANCNGQKKVIELFGNYWHTGNRIVRSSNSWKRTELGRIMAYNFFGFECLVIWEDELEDLRALKVKIKKFNRRCKVK